MNKTRLMLALQELMLALHELVDAFLPEQGSQSAKPEQRRPRRQRTLARPPGNSDELARAAAKRALREHGFVEAKQ